jgi:hypothetical protein
MSSTITVSRRASAFRAPNGNIYYALWETTYESNVYPGTPHESCVAFGSIRRVMAWIYVAMESCAGGMLRSRNGSLTPAGYLRSWQAALSAPIRLRDREIVLSTGGWRAPIPRGEAGSWHDPDKLPFALEKLRALPDYDEKAARLEAGGQIRLSLHQDAEALADIYGDCAGNGIAPWRILDTHSLWDDAPDASLAPPKPTAKKDCAPAITLYAIERPEYGHADCHWVCALVKGYCSITEYGGVMSTYIREVANKMEAADYGAGLVAIRAMEAEMKKPIAPAPGSLQVSINLRDERFKHSKERAEGELAVLVDGLGNRATLTEDHLVTTLADLRDAGLVDVAMGLTYRRPRFEEVLIASAGIRGCTADLFGMAA